MTLTTLLLLAGIDRYAAWVWFREAQLSGQTLQVAPEVEPTIRRCYLPALQVAIPDLVLASLSDNRPSVFRTGTRTVQASPQQAQSLFPDD